MRRLYLHLNENVILNSVSISVVTWGPTKTCREVLLPVTFSKLNPSQSAGTETEKDTGRVRQRSRETETQSDSGSDIPNVNGSFLMLSKFLRACTCV